MELGITPVLYGSLGLSRVVGEKFLINDIDILIPDVFLKDKFSELINVMLRFGFSVFNHKEHQFVRDSVNIEFACTSVLADINLSLENLRVCNVNGITFRMLDVNNYLSAYKFCLTDGYRKTKKTDYKKIEIIEEYMKTL